jgi:hypothetical protein
MTSIFAVQSSQIGISTESSNNIVFSVTCDSTGNVYIGGRFSGTSTFGTGGNLYNSVNGGSNTSGFIAKYLAGNLSTVSDYSQIGLDTDTGNSAEVFGVACDSTGNVYICGFFQGNITFGNLGITQNSPLGSSGYVAKYTLGNLATVSEFSQIGSAFNATNSSTSGVVCDLTGNVYVSGNFTGVSTFGTFGITKTSTGSGGNNSGFVVKYLNLSTNPILTNISQIGLTSDSVSGSGSTTSIACDGVGNIYVCGGFSRTITFGNLGLQTSAVAPGNSGYVIKYNLGNLATVSQFSQIGLGSESSVNNASSVACDLTGNVYIGGKFSSGALLAPTTFGAGGPTRISTSNYSGFVVKYNLGNLTIVTQISQIGLQGETTYNDVLGVTCDLTGNIYICGTFGYGFSFPFSSTFGAGGPQLTSVSSAQSGYMLKYLNLNLVSKYSQIGLTSEISDNVANGVACDLNGIIYVCGDFGDINGGVSANTTFGTGGPTLASNFNYSGFVVRYMDPPICYNRGTKILCENGYRLIEELKIGDLVQTYLHGNLPIECIKSNKMINNPDKWSECMYRLPLTEFEDLIVTGGHGILKNTINDLDSDKMWINSYRFSKIGKLFLHRAAFCKDFIKIETAEQFEYYHLSLKGKNNKRYGIWANGVLSESIFKPKVI